MTFRNFLSACEEHAPITIFAGVFIFFLVFMALIVYSMPSYDQCPTQRTPVPSGVVCLEGRTGRRCFECSEYRSIHFMR